MMQPFESRLETNTIYLTNELAYFLGGIVAANEFVQVGNKCFVLAPVRYNFGYASPEQIEAHRLAVEQMAHIVGGKTYTNETVKGGPLDSGKLKLPGFATYFEAKPDFSYEYLSQAIINYLENASPVLKRCFLVGAFDGRGYIDFNKKTNRIRAVVIDCTNSLVAETLINVLEKFGFDPGYNVHRDRLSGGHPRNNQLKIHDSSDYYWRVGFISPKKLELGRIAVRSKGSSITEKDNSDILNGLHTLKGSY